MILFIILSKFVRKDKKLTTFAHQKQRQMIKIRATQKQDIPAIMAIYEVAKLFMRANGNGSQWANGYPWEELIEEDCQAGHSFVCVDEADEPIGTFCFFIGDEPTYQQIFDGAWLDDAPYGVIHRLASNGKQRGIAQACLDWAFQQCPNIRIDTHHNNRVMRSLLTLRGFIPCGTIFVEDGTPRIAFQKQA